MTTKKKKKIAIIAAAYYAQTLKEESIEKTGIWGRTAVEITMNKTNFIQKRGKILK